MASVNGNLVTNGSSYSWRVICEVTQTSSTNSTVTYRARAKFYTKWSIRSYCNGSLSGAVSASYDGSTGTLTNGNSGTYTYLTKSFTVNRGTAAKSISVTAKMQVTGGFGNGTSTATCSVTVPKIPVTKPGVPKNVSAVRQSDDDIIITWDLVQPTNGSISTVDAQFSRDDGAWSTLKSNMAGTTEKLTHTSALTNRKYKYRVRAGNSAGDSSWSSTSNVVYTTPDAPGKGYALQRGTTVNANVITSNINWPDHYEWQRSSDGSTDWTTIEGQTADAITDTTKIESPYYRVRCIGKSGLVSDWSATFQASATVSVYLNVPDEASNPQVYVQVPDGTNTFEVYLNV